MIELKNFRNLFKKQPCIVCGTGLSLKEFIPYHKTIHTIGVNDVVKDFTPNWLLTQDNLPPNPEHQEKIDRIMNNKSDYTFSYQPYEYPNSQVINYKISWIGSGSLYKIFNENKLGACMTSVETAISLAIFCGFEYIGVIGWDLIEHGATQHIDKIDNDMLKLYEYAVEHYQLIFNLSKESKVKVIPKINLFDFMLKYGLVRG